jgi:hypothetical protein
MPGYRFLWVPHPIANLTEGDLDVRATALVEPVMELLQQK